MEKQQLNFSAPQCSRMLQSAVRPLNVTAKLNALHFAATSAPSTVCRIKNWIYQELGQNRVTYGHSCLPTSVISPLPLILWIPDSNQTCVQSAWMEEYIHKATTTVPFNDVFRVKDPIVIYNFCLLSFRIRTLGII